MSNPILAPSHEFNEIEIKVPSINVVGKRIFNGLLGIREDSYYWMDWVWAINLYLAILYEHIIYMIYIYVIRNRNSFLFRLLPHYMFWPLRAIFRWNKCININSVFVKTITLYLIHPLLRVLLSILYYLSINSYIIFFKIA
jgi:hypothetical protein